MSAPLRIGILGAARIAPEAIGLPASGDPRAQLQAIAARDPARARAMARDLGIAHVAESYDALIARQDVDLVYIALPPSAHAAWAVAALGAGKHVLCEKPLARNLCEARAMCGAASGARLIEAFHYRYHPLFAYVMEVLAGGHLGPVRHVEAALEIRLSPAAAAIRRRPELGGGALMDLGCYAAHWIRSVTGAEPVVASAQAIRSASGVDDAVQADLLLPGGATARLACSFIQPEHALRKSLDIQCRDGRLSVDNPLNPQKGHAVTVTQGGRTETYAFSRRPTFDWQLSAVIDGLRGGQPLPTEGDDLLRNAAVLDAIARRAGLDFLLA